jgi:hypothetical protein
VDTLVVVSGNISAPVQFLSKTAVASDTLSVRDYAGGTTASGSPVGIAERIWLNGSYWPQETAKNTGRYIQYSVSPVIGNNFTIQSIALNLGQSGGSNIYASISYSTDSTFATSTEIYTPTAALPDIRSVSWAALSFSPGTVVNSGQTLYLRIYPWFNSSKTSNTKYVCVDSVIVSGTTVAIGAPSLTVLPVSLSFGKANVNTGRDRSFSVSGTLLIPASGNVTITAPTDFIISTTYGTGYSSSITLPYTNGTISSTTIYTRFIPTTIQSYADSIIVSGGSALNQKVTVSGTGLPADAILGIFVSSTGSDSAAGTFTAPYLTLQKAIAAAQPGDTIFVRAGKYVNNKTISISSSGTSANYIALYAYPSDSVRPLFDFSSMIYGSSNRGVALSGSYWHIKGLDIYRAGDNGMYTSGSHNIVEFCAFHENRDGGCQIGGGGAYNQFINCDSYFNFDDSTYTSGVLTPGGNADGFSPKLDMGNGNYFYGCRSWQNSDDGWDGFQETVNDDTTYLTNCWTWKNGYLKDGVTRYSSMNGNGFKMGGNGMVHNFIVSNCLSFDNYAKGFDQNNGTGSLTILNCTAFRNNGAASSYRDFYIPGAMATGKQLILENCISYTNYVSATGPATKTIATCSWSSGFTTPSASDFLSVDTTGVSGPRKADGSLPDIAFMHLATTSQFVNKGTGVGLTYIGTAPDLGCFETNVLTGVESLPSGRIAEYQLLQNYPNPFNPSTVISYQLTKRSYVTIQVYDALGREIATLEKNWHDAGLYHVTFTANNLASGIYFCRMNAEAQQKIIKLLLVK